MEKKTYLKGFLSGVVVVVLLATLGRGFHVVKDMTGKTMPTDTKIQMIEKYLDKYYVEEIDKESMAETMYAGLVAGIGDPYTSYFSADDLASFMDETEGSFSGIGVEITTNPKDHSILVVAPIEGGPAQEAGVLTNDKIIKVNDKDIAGLSMDAVVVQMKGPEGSKVKITVYRESTGEVLNFDLTRKNIQVKSVKHKMLADGIGYLKLTGFRSNSYEQFMEAYQDLQKQNMKGLIIDVRNNPGGLLDSVEKIADELVPKGTIVYTIDKAGNRKDSLSDEKRIEVPLVLLVNGYSASASEILAGAVQDMGVGKLVGTQTFGKGLVQGLFPLPDGSGLKITIQKYYTPKGVCIQGKGIAPDYVVELPEEYQYSLGVPEEADTQLKKAMEVIKEKMN